MLPPPVVIVPGLPGSKLSRTGTDDLVWIDINEMVFRKDEFLEDLILTQNNYDVLSPSGILARVDIPLLFDWQQYSRLVQFLRRQIGLPQQMVKGFGYDWRKSIKQAAERLQTCVSDWRAHEFAGEKCAIIAHSTGGLVSRYYIEKLGGEENVQHLFLLGTPNTGLLKSFQAMYKGSNLYCIFTPEEVRQMGRSFETTYELLPWDPNQRLLVDSSGAGIQLFEDRRWIPTADGSILNPLLDRAWQVLQELPATSSVPATVVYSDGLDTFAQAVFNGQRVEFKKSLVGDLTVPSVSAAALSGERVVLRPVPFAIHADLYAHNAVKEILRTGLTGASPPREYFQCGLMKTIGRAGDQNKIIIEMRGQRGQPLPNASVEVESTPSFLGVTTLPPSSRHAGQFELEFHNPQRERTYAIFLTLYWTDNGASRSRQETLLLKVI